MSEEKNGGPAFPHTVRNDDGSYFACFEGMSLRDWFAGQALMGMTSRIAYDRMCAARDAYEYADAMLAARASQVQP